MRLRSMTALGFLLVAAACGEELEQQSEIRRVRVLGVKSTPSELALPTAGGLPAPLQLEALAVAPDGSTPPVTFALCAAGNVYSADFQCPGKDGLTLPGGRLDLGDPAVQAFVAQAFVAPGAGGGPVDPNDPALAAALEAGIPFFVGFLADDGSGRPEGQERGVRQLKLRRTDTPNQNPELADVLYEGASLTTLPAGGQTVELRPVLAAGAQEPLPGKDANETVSFAWHASGEGDVEFFRSVQRGDDQPGEPTTEYVTPEAPGRVTFYVVARDGRGGTGWLVRDVEVQ